jgi:hypothetical protein
MLPKCKVEGYFSGQEKVRVVEGKDKRKATKALAWEIHALEILLSHVHNSIV